MSCGHCVKAVEGSVGELNGVSRVKVNLENGTVDVEFNTDAVTLEAIMERLLTMGKPLQDFPPQV